MNHHRPPNSMSLFDLIARTWSVGVATRQVLFNGDATALAAVLADGTLAFVAVDDAEHPDKRMRMELETGRTTIRPREQPVPAPVLSEGPVADADTAIWRLGDKGFAFLHWGGEEIWRATARGLTLRLVPAQGMVSALATHAASGRLAVARGSTVTLYAGDEAEAVGSADLGHDVVRLAVSGDGRLLACWGSGEISIFTTDGLVETARISCGGAVSALTWSPDGRWLAGACADKCILLVDVEAAATDEIVDFPAPVSDALFSGPAGALIASGAFRVVGWKLPDLPFGDHEGEHIETGKPGLTIVDRVVPHPRRDLCAVAYANGLVTVSQVGRRDELMLREGDGQAVASLAWSGEGSHLAIGQTDGAVSIATFPKNMFK